MAQVKLVLKQQNALRLRFQPGATGARGPTGTGETGPANELEIGTVTALDYGEPANASITGTAPNQVLNLWLPAGEQGPSGSVTDGDKGDIVVSGGGTVWTIEDGSVDYDKLAVVAEDRSQAGFKIEDLGDPDAPTDAVNLQTADARYLLAPTGMIAPFLMASAPSGWIKANGALIVRTDYSALDTAIYCGDSANATAEWGYRTNSDDTVRSTTGTHLRLPNVCGEFVRGWDDARGVDSGRSLWSTQADAFKAHTHTVSDPGHVHNDVGGGGTVGSGIYPAGQAANSYVLAGQTAKVTGITVQNTGGVETRPRNIVALYCIKT